MTEARLPLNLAQANIKFFPFYYDLTRKVFNIGSRTVELVADNLVKELSFPTGGSVNKSEIPHHPVHLSYIGDPIATPMLFDWLKADNFGKEERLAVRQVMHDVYEEIEGEKLERNPDWNDISRGFGVSNVRGGHVSLVTLGDDSSLGVALEGLLIDQHDWDSHYAEYEFHNVNLAPQRISLLAGLGHLARLAS